MRTPQIVVIVLLSCSWCLHLVKHGEPQGEYHVGWETLAIALTVALLDWGGFWK